MSTGPFPEQVDHRKLAVENSKLEGSMPLATFGRLVEGLESDAADVRISLEFRKARKQKVKIVGTCEADVLMVCQNCLSSLEFHLRAEIRQWIVESEVALTKLPEDEDGIVCLDEKIRLVDIVEDELILSLPMVARHDEGACELVAHHQNDDSPAEPATHKPFAGLAELKDKLIRNS
ncbi:MAG: YceD family protein [Pseudomonadales bacterium]|jgi:uncharacterized protein|nr:YceD family protein [Pseudomonadales bacterium]MDP6316649.1 YceD family protein [Pseudomonadales bacterium]MDP7576726.1 YceD family protein [Pseudomonadales bacterium]HJP51866.1 YceD family protein [Pseudomonadales bacterium]|tara:strand:+ start:1670 stop:2200 length:531 start_codon:yes stop_codon:yes gene_type:complete